MSFTKPLFIEGVKSWRSHAFQDITHRYLVLSNIKSACWSNENGSLINPNRISSRVVKVEKCSEDFVFYHLNPYLFSNIKVLLLYSHPMNENVLQFWNDYTASDFVGVLHPRYRHLINRNRNSKWFTIDEEHTKVFFPEE
jgi:hypothetical protein